MFLKGSIGLDIECLSTLFTNTVQKQFANDVQSSLFANTVRPGLYLALVSVLRQGVESRVQPPPYPMGNVVFH
jgi:hypothetical protein